MKRHNKKLIVTMALLLAAGSALAVEVIEAWGYGVTPFAARNDARSLGRQACLDLGYSFATFEEVQTYPSGGAYVTYGLSTCY